MNENNLYYRRGMYIIDKMLKQFNNDNTFYKKRLEFIKMELNRLCTNKNLVEKDINSFYITSLSALMGLNKENIENMNRHRDYNLSDVNCIRDDVFLNQIKKDYPCFDKDRNIPTKFDKWLSVERCDYPTDCYMMNIRNGILHSEYEPLGEFGDLLSIKNSNYMHFKSKVILLGLLDFCELYFGNSGWLGVSENFNIYGSETETQITNEKELDTALDSITVTVFNYEYKGKCLDYKIPELKLVELFQKLKNNTDLEQIAKKVFSGNYDYSFVENKITQEQKNIVKKIIEKYYGDNFYKLDNDAQMRNLCMAARYLIDSRMVISEWICDYVELLNYINQIFEKSYKKKEEKAIEMINGFDIELNQRSIFAARTSLLILKLYQILYRLQYKNYEEVDFNMIDFDTSSSDYSYERIDKNGSTSYDFNIDKAKMTVDYPNDSNKEIENRIICEIIRDALCHGNIEMNFKIENDELVEYIILEDIYKGRIRKLEITLDKLETFINSNAFKVENCIVKENNQKVKVIQ